MAKLDVNINNNSVTSSVTSDPKKAICEYIWNGFDANATTVNIDFKANELGYIYALKIKDDGDGIDRSLLGETFGTYQDSIKKKSYEWSSQVQGHKGKGRYSFNCFSSRATWESVYKKDGKYLKHSLYIDSRDNQHYNDNSEEIHKITHDCKTGTIVSFDNVNLNKEFFESGEFVEYLKREYAVFLKLNERKSKSIIINGKKLDYTTVIADSDTKYFSIKGSEKSNDVFSFDVIFIRWVSKMKENYCVYYLDSNEIEKYEKTTSLNKKDNGFHHSLYVTSSYFDNFVFSKDLGNSHDLFGNKTEKDEIFRSLNKRLKDWLANKQKNFIRDIAGEMLWKRYESQGIVKKPTNEYDLPLYNDLKETIKGIYVAQPKIFTNLHQESAKTLVGMIRLLLQSDKREDILTILESVVSLSDEERKNLIKVLKSTDLAHITDTIQMLQNRLRIVNSLKQMLFDRALNAEEVKDIQNFVSSSFWLFGEEYNIVTEAEPDFEQALMCYLQKLNSNTKGVSKSIVNKIKLNDPDKNKEMDIFAFRQNVESKKIENLVVELKRPSVKLGELEVSQVKTYMKVITSDSRFNASNKCIWKFFLVGNEYDNSGYIEGELENSRNWGKEDLLYNKNGNNGVKYEIYVKKWSDVFADFDMRYNYLMKKLAFKKGSNKSSCKTKEALHTIVDEAKKNT